MNERRKTLKVAGLGNLSLLESHRAYLKELGNGNMSEGVRRLITLAQKASTYLGAIDEMTTEYPSLISLFEILVQMESGGADSQLSESE